MMFEIKRCRESDNFLASNNYRINYEDVHKSLVNFNFYNKTLINFKSKVTAYFLLLSHK